MKIKLLISTALCIGVFTGICFAGIADKVPVDFFTTKYDSIIRKETKRCFSVGMDYRWLKSQVAAESNFNPNAVSPVGARGLAQFMKPTFNDVVKRSGYIKDDIFNPRWNLAAQAWYNRRLYNNWSAKRTELSRIQLMMCSYNSGLKYPLIAQKICITKAEKNCNEWQDIRKFASEVPGWIHEESLNYTKKISSFMGYREN